MSHKSTSNLEQDGNRPQAETPPISSLNPFFRLLIPSTVLFVFFTLAWLVASLGDAASPVAQWFARNGHWPIALFFATSLLCGILALGLDNHQNNAWIKLHQRLQESAENADGLSTTESGMTAKEPSTKDVA
ncbi:MAG: hypothetical protein ACKVT0_13295 [Planctomycetaceae bacterium]